MILLGLAIIFALLIYGLDQHFRLMDVENDLKILLGDFLVARDIAEGRARVHYQASVVALKQVIKENFKE